MGGVIYKSDARSAKLLTLFPTKWLDGHEGVKEKQLDDKELVIYCYTRYSTDAQNENSTARQIGNIVSWLEKNLASKPISKFFCDEAKSGRSVAGRVKLAALLEEARQKKFHVLVIEDTSRLSRWFGDMSAIWQLLREHGIRVFSTKHGELDLLTMAITGVLAQIDRETIIERTRDGRYSAVETDNRYIVGEKAFGYQKKINGLPGDIEPHPINSKIIKKIGFLLVIGFSRKDVCEYLHSKGIKSATGGRFTPGVIGRSLKYGGGMMNNPLLCGQPVYGRCITTKDPMTGKKNVVMRHHDHWACADRPDLALMSKARWDVIQEKIEADLKPGRKPQNKYLYLAQGILFCKCGLPMLKCDSGIDPTVECRSRLLVTIHKPRSPCAFSRSVHLRHIDRAVISILEDALDDDCVGKMFIEEFNSELSNLSSHENQERKRLSLDIQNVRGKMDAAFAAQHAFANKVGSQTILPHIAQSVQRYCEELAGLESKLAALRPPHTEIKMDLTRLPKLRELLGDFAPSEGVYQAKTPEERATVALFHRFVKKITVQRQANSKAMEINIQFDWTGSDPVLSMHGRNFVTQEITRVVTIEDDKSHRARAEKIVEAVRNQVGLSPLSDSDYELCSDLLTRWITRSRDGTNEIDGRLLLNASLFMARVGQPTSQMPREYGDRKTLLAAVTRLVYHRAFDEMVNRLRLASSSAVDGLSTACFNAYTRKPVAHVEPMAA